ncbi:very short patch repair endonuclease [Frateuria sp. GZRe12]|uniref:very short patch repair endonuclease n=1 Tax=Frateuria sp. GZRe12 TaxID=3351533 RepID=UPI003EDBF3B3
MSQKRQDSPFKNAGLRVRGLRTTLDRSEVMSKVRQAGTKPELAVRAALKSLRVRYTIDNRDLPGSPDLANRRKRFVIFVHGCFWHRHIGCSRTTTPTRNREFWLQKFEANVDRDVRATEALAHAGFRVLTIWECEALDASRLLEILSRFFDAESEL